MTLMDDLQRNSVGPLNGRVALVTGSARGLGLGIAKELAGCGALVYCADLAGADEAAETLRALPGSPGGESSSFDICDRSGAARAMDSILSQQGRLDIVVNNAGIVQQFGPLSELDHDLIKRVIEVNLVGAINCCAEAATRVTDGSGRIINIASQYGLLARPNYAPYSAAKAGVIALTQALALELAHRGVTVNAVCPGTMLTEMVRDAFEQRAIAAGLKSGSGDDLIESFPRDSIPAGRMGTPLDVGKMVAWIASDASSFTTGSAFNITGGETLS